MKKKIVFIGEQILSSDPHRGERQKLKIVELYPLNVYPYTLVSLWEALLSNKDVLRLSRKITNLDIQMRLTLSLKRQSRLQQMTFINIFSFFFHRK